MSFKNHLESQGKSKSTVSHYTSYALDFLSWLDRDNTEPENATAKEVLAYLNHLQKKGQENKTRNIRLNVIDQIKQELLTVYPNPTKDVAYFSTYTNVRVTNAVGQVIDVWKNVNTIDLSAEPAGIYIITFTNNEGEIVQRSKIVKE